MRAIPSEIRAVLRSARRFRGSTVVGWATSAIWLACAPAFVSLLGALQWKSLPFPDSGRIVNVNAGFDLVPSLVAAGQFAAISTYSAGWATVAGPGGAASALSAVVDEDFFRVVKVQPTTGRLFRHGGGSSEAGSAVLSEGLSRQLFGSSVPPAHAAIRTGGRLLEVLGVVPDRPVFPPQVELWVHRLSDLEFDANFFPPGSLAHGIVGRLNPGVGPKETEEAVRISARRFEARTNLHQGDIAVFTLAELLRRRTQGERAVLLLSFFGLLGFVALASIGALSGFMLERRSEMAVRIALGARRASLIRQLLFEVLLLGLPGFVAGLPVSVLVMRELAGLVPPNLAALLPGALDLGSLALATATWGAVETVCFVAVWFSAPGIGVRSLLAHEGEHVRAMLPEARVRLSFVVAAVAVAVALGAVTSMLRESLARLEREPLGFNPRGAVTAVAHFSAPAPGAIPATLERVAESVRAVPGMEAVSFSDALPLGDRQQHRDLEVPGSPRAWLARTQGIAGDYLRAAGIRLIAGRDFRPSEVGTGAAVALLDAAGAYRVFEGRQALGHTILVDRRPFDIVGIVASVKDLATETVDHPQVYLPLTLGGPAGREQVAVAMVVRPVLPVSEAAWSAAAERAGASLSQIRPLTELVAGSRSAPRLARNLATCEWAAAVGLLALATFSTFSWRLHVREHELAVRAVLGESRSQIATRLLRGALELVAAGLVLGFALYLPVGRALRSLVFGVADMAPSALLRSCAGVSGAVMLSALVATGLALSRLSFDPLRR